MATTSDRATYPIQIGYGQHGKVNAGVYLAAYEVYCQVFGAQDALVTGDCRGGLGTGEIIAFLYARSFPREQWRDRVREASEGMEVYITKLLRRKHGNDE